MDVAFDVAEPSTAVAAAVLLHPHPQFGGDRFHPLVDTLFRRLPPLGIGAIRFDFASADAESSRSAAEGAVAEAGRRFGPSCPVAVVGYSFGGGVAAHVDGDAVAGWVLVAPQATPLVDSPIGASPKPKLVIVAERDQFAPPDVINEVVGGWPSTTVEVVPGDHFLSSSLGGIVDHIVEWLGDRRPR